MDYPFFLWRINRDFCVRQRTQQWVVVLAVQQIEITIEWESSRMVVNNGFGKMHKIDISCVYFHHPNVTYVHIAPRIDDDATKNRYAKYKSERKKSDAQRKTDERIAGFKATSNLIFGQTFKPIWTANYFIKWATGPMRMPAKRMPAMHVLIHWEMHKSHRNVNPWRLLNWQFTNVIIVARPAKTSTKIQRKLLQQARLQCLCILPFASVYHYVQSF